MIYTNMVTCEDCIHRRVCNMKDKFSEAAQEAVKLSDQVIDIIEISVQCKEFGKDIAVRKPFADDYLK